LKGVGLLGYAYAAEYRLGAWIGGEEGGAESERAARQLREAGVANPERFADFLVPDPRCRPAFTA
jgi:hypothetical protein